MNIGDRVFVRNQEKQIWEIGSIVNSYRRDKIQRYDVQMERGIKLDFLSIHSYNIFYIDMEKTRQFFNKINP
jgi:hypothetical protein